MADRTSIEWTDSSWTPIKGCRRVSEGCRNCYAEIMAARFSKPGQWGHGLAEIVGEPGNRDHRWTGAVRFDEAELTKPLRWRKPRKVFVCSTSDLFAEGVPDEWIDRVFAVMALAPQHTFQVLTKRPERMRRYMLGLDCDGARRFNVLRHVETLSEGVRWKGDPSGGIDGEDERMQMVDNATDWPPRHVWLGASVEDQRRADERIPVLLDTPAAVRWISAEPLLGPLDLRIAQSSWPWDPPGPPTFSTYDVLSGARHYRLTNGETFTRSNRGGATLDWVVVGGESGPDARPMHPAWARSLRDQCAAAGVPFHFKQWGEWLPWEPTDVPFWRAADGREVDRHVLLPADMDADPRWDDGLQESLGTTPAAFQRVGKKRAGRLLDGVTHDGMPA